MEDKYSWEGIRLDGSATDMAFNIQWWDKIPMLPSSGYQMEVHRVGVPLGEVRDARSLPSDCPL